MISKSDIENIQNKWGDTLIKIGSLKDQPDECRNLTTDALKELYAFELGDILFKPTKATKIAFRSNLEGSLSYFIGNNDNFSEDKGFALNPWTKVSFENKIFNLGKNTAQVMGYYHFTDLDNNITTVEYTFGYVLVNGDLKINIHHSSLPFSN